MNGTQNGWLTEYQSLDQFFAQQGAPLLAIPDIDASYRVFTGFVPRILIQATLQARTGAAQVAARRALKRDVAPRAEALRLLVRGYAQKPDVHDADLAQQFHTPFSQKLTQGDLVFTQYLSALATTGRTLLTPLASAGVIRDDIDVLEAAATTLTNGKGANLVTDAVAQEATTELDRLFRAANLQLSTQLDLFVRGQAFKQATLVSEYNTLRHPPVVARRRPRPTVLRGELLPETPVFLYDRTTANAPIPTFGNLSGKRRVLRYFSAPTADPTTADPKTGLLVNNRRKRQLDDYAQLGDPHNSFVFVLLLGSDGPGHYYASL